MTAQLAASRSESGGSAQSDAIAAVATNTRRPGLLYRRTLNRVEIFAPTDSEAYRIEASTGKTVKGNQIRLSPSGETVVLQVYAGDRHLGKKKFDVVDPPRPHVKAFDDSGSQILCGDGLRLARPVLKFKVEPDSAFATRHPKDANYQVRRAKVEMAPTGLDHGGELDVVDLGSDGVLKGKLIRLLRQVGAQPRDRLIIHLQKVVRINHNGRAVPVDMPESLLTFEFRLY